MRASASIALGLVLVLAPNAALPCGVWECDRSGYRDANALDTVILRPYDWRYQRLPTLIRAYYGEQAATLARGTNDTLVSVVTRAEYDAAITRLFASLHRAVPALPAPAKDGPGWDGACALNDYAAAWRFVDGLANDDALGPHAERLVGWRTRLVGMCPANADAAASLIGELDRAGANNADLGDATNYLAAATLFYTGKPAEAATRFKALKASSHGWIGEAATYTYARALMVAAQVDWDGYSYFDRIDGLLLEQASAAFEAYLDAYPRGRYVESASNIVRRLAYLAGDAETLNRLAVARFTRLLAARDFAEIGLTASHEITEYVDVASLTVDDFPFESPLLAATLAPHAPVLIEHADTALARLAAAKAVYAEYPGLYELVAVPLLAAAKRPEAFAIDVPADAPASVRYGVHYERALAFERNGRNADARRALRQVAVELPALVTDDAYVADILRLHFADNDFSDAGAPGSPFLDADVAADLFERIASEDVIAAMATGDVAPAAHAELLFRMLREKRWKEFVDLYERSGKPTPFTDVETAARSLVTNPSNPKGLFNVGFFLKLQNGYAHPCCPCEKLKNAPPSVIDSRPSAVQFYVDALDALDEQPDAGLEPKVLANAILCFKESTDAAFCRRGLGSALIDKSTRAAWFKRLKTKYASSSWAAETKYWY